MKIGAWPDRNKWFLLGVLFLCLNGWALLRFDGLSWRKNDFCLATFECGDGATVKSNNAVAWRFNENMVESRVIGEWFDSGPGTFTPEVRGSYCWSAPNRLVFQPEQAWPLCAYFTVSLDSRLKSVSDRALALPRVFSFKSDPLVLLGAEQVGTASEDYLNLQLRFNAPVLPQSLKESLVLRASSGQVLHWAPSGQVAGNTVFVRICEFPGKLLQLSLGQGLLSAAGPLGLQNSITTNIPCYDKFAIIDFQADSPAFEPAMVLFATSTPLEISEAASFIRVEPEVRFSLEAYKYNYRNFEYRLIGAFKPGSVYTVFFKQGLKDTLGNSLRKESAYSAFIPNRSKGVTFKTEGIYLSSRGAGQIPVLTSNVRQLKVSVERVFPNNLVQFAMRRAGRYESCRRQWDRAHHAISRVVATSEYSVVGTSDDTATTMIRLRSLLGDNAGGVYYLSAEGESILSAEGESIKDGRLVVFSDIGLSIKRTAHEMLVWANSILSLAPITGAEVRVFTEANQAIAEALTDEQGLADLHGDFSGESKPFLVVVSRGEDLTFLSLAESVVAMPDTQLGPAYTGGKSEAYVFTDRGIYRPGESAHVKVVVRDEGLECPARFPVELDVTRPDGRKRPALTGLLNDVGVAEFAVDWAEYDMAGRYSLQVRLPGSETPLGSTTVAVEEFVPPQLAVAAEMEPGRGKAGAEQTVRVSARHLFGAPASGSPVKAGMSVLPVAFAHPDWPDYVFSDPIKLSGPVSVKFDSKKLNEQGEESYKFKIPEGCRPASALEMVFMAAVMDIGGRAVALQVGRPIDVYPCYMGIRKLEQGALMAGRPVSFELAAVLPDGVAQTNAMPLQLALASVSWSSALRVDDGGHYRYSSERRFSPVFEKSIVMENGRVKETITPEAAGEYMLSLRDPVGGASSAIFLYVGSPEQTWMARSMEKPDRATLRFDKASYKPGQEATLSIQAPFAGKALLTLESDRILEKRVITLEGNTAEIRLPVKAEYQPNVYAVLNLIRPAVADEIVAPNRAVGAALLKVERPDACLKLEMKAPELMLPKQALDIDLSLKRADGAPEPGAEFTIAAVDEGICALTDFTTPDPSAFFMGPRKLGVELFDLYALLMPEIGPQVAGAASTPGGDGDFAIKRSLNPVRAQRFKPVALWRSGARSDADGRARISLEVPEFTGELRLTAVAVGTNRFASSSRQITVRRPLIARGSLPRFLAPGDVCRLPVELLNNTASSAEAVARVSCEGPLSLRGVAEQSVFIATNAKAELAFELTAGLGVGKAKVSIVASLGSESTVEETEIAVRPQYPSLTLTGSGAIPAGAAELVQYPTNWLAGTCSYGFAAGGLPSLQLAGALSYLLNYPYGCIEQTISAVFPLLYFADLTQQLQPGSTSIEGINIRLENGILKVLAMQTASGGFAYWPHSTEEYEWGSVYATHFLVEAAALGHDVPRDRLESAVRYLQGLLARSTPQDVASAQWKGDMGARAYACHVLALVGRPEPGWVARLNELADKLAPDSLAHLAAAMAVSGRRREATAFLQAFGGDSLFKTPRAQSSNLGSAAQSAALLLNLWLDLDPEHPDVPGLAARLDGLRKGDRWNNTQENAMALLALGKYSRWLAGRQKAVSGTIHWAGAGKQFAGETPLKLEWRNEPPSNLSISNAGPGTAYFSWRAEGVPLPGVQQEEDSGFRIRRVVYEVDGSAHNGETFVQGELYVVCWQLDGLKAGMENVIVEDLLPAGFEIENANLRTSENIAWVKDKSTMPMRHIEARDDRMIGVAAEVSEPCRFFYAVRAVSEGEFVMPALQASCMYDPGLRSIAGAGRIKVAGAGAEAP